MNIFKFFLTATIFLPIVSDQTFAQSDTVFYDQKWRKSSRDEANFYRLIEVKNFKFEVKDYYLNGVLQMSGTFISLDPGDKTGFFQYFNQKGSIDSEGSYVKNSKDGEWKEYDSLGKIIYSENYHNNKLDGELKGYFENGSISRQEIYKNGSFVSGKCFNENGKKIKFFHQKEAAKYPGGVKELMLFLNNNLIYPTYAVNNNIEGKVWVRFIISATGKVSDVKITEGVHKVLNDAAIGVILQMPDWIPGKFEGKPVNTYFELPINFKLK